MNKVSGFLAVGVLLLALVSLRNLPRNVAQASKPGQEVRTERTISADGITALKTEVKVGSLQVIADTSRDVRVTAVRTIRGGDADKARQWREAARVVVERQGNAVNVVDDVPKSLKFNEGGWPRTYLDVEVHVPRQSALNSHVAVGNTILQGIFGDVSLDTGTGGIQASELRCDGDRLDAHVGVGDTAIGFQSLPWQRVRVEIGVGKATLMLPARSNAVASLESGMGHVSSAFSLRRPHDSRLIPGGKLQGEVNGGGGTQIEARVGVGDLRLE